MTEYVHSETLRGFQIPLAVLDFETYYDQNYSLSKLTTEAYIRDPRFEIILVGLITPDGQRLWFTGTKEELKERLKQFPWHEWAVVAHNTMFDAAIATWHLDIKPALWLDTLSMARAMGLSNGPGGSLAALAKYYGLSDKGTYVGNMLGVRRMHMNAGMFHDYAGYCMQDCELTLQIFDRLYNGWYCVQELDLRGKYPLNELLLIDVVIRMFSEPVFELDVAHLQAHLQQVQNDKAQLLVDAGVTMADLQSAAKFCELLEKLGVEIPMKISPKTGKPAPALAKTDQGMKELLEHADERVQALAAARLGVKSTLEETRTVRFLDIASRGRFPVPLAYGKARTHRLAGEDKINLQNLPSRGKNAKSIKKGILAPPDHVAIDADSSNIEARGVAWLAGQTDLVAAFANKEDVYSTFASIIYDKPINKKDHPVERFVGKETVLGSGYGMGWVKFKGTLKAKNNMDIADEEAQRIINLYRSVYSAIPALWKAAETAIHWMYTDQCGWLGCNEAVWVDGRKGIKLPNGLYIHYPDLAKDADGWSYRDGKKGRTKIYGAKLIENIVQALARIIVMWQLVKISRRYKVALTVHDAICIVVPASQRDEAISFVANTMRQVPKWAQGWPVDCEIGYGPSYGEQIEVKV